MPNGMQGFINTFFQVEALKQQRQQQQMLEQNARTQRAAVLTNLGRLTSSEQGREALAQLSEDPEFGQFLSEISPAAQTLVEEATLRGFEAMDPQRQEEIDEIAAARGIAGTTPSGVAAEQFLQEIPLGADEETLAQLGRARGAQVATQMAPGELARDLAVADLSPEALEAEALISGGQRLSAMQREQVSMWASQLGLQTQDLIQRGALGTTSQMIQVWNASQQHELARMQGLPGAEGMTPNEAIQALGRHMTAIAEVPDTDEELSIHIAAVNAALDQLAQAGRIPGWAENEEGVLEPIIPRLSSDPSDLQPGGIRRLWRALFGARSEPGQFPETVGPMMMQGTPSAPSTGIPASALLEVIRSGGASMEDLEEMLESVMGGGGR